MRNPSTLPAEEPAQEKFERFIRLLGGIASVPKTAIYELDPRLRPGSQGKTERSPGEGQEG